MRRDRHYRRSTRSRFTFGILLLVGGAFFLAINLGVRVPQDVWDYWPVLPLALGVAQLLWPGSARERLGGLFFIGVGAYCFISWFEIFGLSWGSAWPILLVSLGTRMVLRNFFRDEHEGSLGGGGNSGQNGPNSTPGSTL